MFETYSKFQPLMPGFNRACRDPNIDVFEQMFGYSTHAQPERFHISAREPCAPSVVFRTFWVRTYDPRVKDEKERFPWLQNEVKVNLQIAPKP
jgi:hypothetical protein